LQGECQNVDAGARELVVTDGPYTELDGGAKPGSIVNHGISVYTNRGSPQNQLTGVSIRVRWIDRDNSRNGEPRPAVRAARAPKG
jgi:hypothetical protein